MTAQRLTDTYVGSGEDECHYRGGPEALQQQQHHRANCEVDQQPISWFRDAESLNKHESEAGAFNAQVGIISGTPEHTTN